MIQRSPFCVGKHYEEDIYEKMAHSRTHKGIKDGRTDGDRHDRHFIGYAGCELDSRSECECISRNFINLDKPCRSAGGQR